jgi:hypothetical protein
MNIRWRIRYWWAERRARARLAEEEGPKSPSQLGAFRILFYFGVIVGVALIVVASLADRQSWTNSLVVTVLGVMAEAFGFIGLALVEYSIHRSGVERQERERPFLEPSWFISEDGALGIEVANWGDQSGKGCRARLELAVSMDVHERSRPWYDLSWESSASNNASRIDIPSHGRERIRAFQFRSSGANARELWIPEALADGSWTFRRLPGEDYSGRLTLSSDSSPARGLSVEFIVRKPSGDLRAIMATRSLQILLESILGETPDPQPAGPVADRRGRTLIADGIRPRPAMDVK